MANLDMPRGFDVKGVPLRVNKYEAGSACYPGDLVTMASDGQVDPVTAGVEILGVCMTYASAAGAVVIVADHPDQLIVGQVESTQVDAQTDIGNVADITATAGNSTYKTSRQEVDGASLAAGSSAQLQILGIVDSPNNALGGFVDVVCRINEHQFGDSNNGV